MKLIEQSYELLGTPKSLNEAWEFVEKASRNCYQSQKSNPNESSEEFCKRILLKHPEDLECDHLSPLEFGIIYLHFPNRVSDAIFYKYNRNPYSRCRLTHTEGLFVTTNLRVIIEKGWEEDLKFVTAPTKYHIKACCFKLITSRAIMAEITRHRTLSFCIESTRYCNYSKDKFGKELTFIQPCWEFSDPAFQSSLEMVEDNYLALLNHGWKPQEAATILPNALKTTIMMCGYENSLQHMFRLRAEECSGPAHPQMTEIMKPLYNDYKQWLNTQL